MTNEEAIKQLAQAVELLGKAMKEVTSEVRTANAHNYANRAVTSAVQVKNFVGT